MANVSAVLFDYGLVLSGPPDPAAWERMKAILGADEASFHAAYWAPRHDYDRGTLTGQAYWLRVADAVGSALDETQIAALIKADTDLWTQPNPAMIDWAAALQRAGIKTGILSNIGDEMEAGVRERCAWIADFAHHTFSHRLKIAKPEAEIYRHAAEGLRTPADQILFIDDRADNIAAARAAGMHTLQYADHASFVSEMLRLGLSSLLAA